MVWARKLFRGNLVAVVRVLIFVAALSFFFDFFANARGLWQVSAGWRFYVTINPLENIAFAVAMAMHLLLLYRLLPIVHTVVKRRRSKRSLT